MFGDDVVDVMAGLCCFLAEKLWSYKEGKYGGLSKSRFVT